MLHIPGCDIEVIPEAHVGFIGVARDEKTHLPTPYLESLPDVAYLFLVR